MIYYLRRVTRQILHNIPSQVLELTHSIIICGLFKSLGNLLFLDFFFVSLINIYLFFTEFILKLILDNKNVCIIKKMSYYIHIGNITDRNIKPKLQDIFDLYNNTEFYTQIKTLEEFESEFSQCFFLIILWNTRLISMCLFNMNNNDKKGYIKYLGVCKSRRKHKFGSAMIYHIKQYFPNTVFNISVSDENIDAIAFMKHINAKYVNFEVCDNCGYNIYIL